MVDNKLQMLFVILVDLAYSLKIHDFRRVTLRVILENLFKGHKIQYKVAIRLARLYNDYYGRNETVESLFDMSSIVNIPHNNSFEIDLKISQNESSITYLYEFIDDVLSRNSAD